MYILKVIVDGTPLYWVSRGEGWTTDYKHAKTYATLSHASRAIYGNRSITPFKKSIEIERWRDWLLDDDGKEM